MDFNIFEGRMVSVLMVGKSDKREGYVGRLSIVGDWVRIEPVKSKVDLEAFYIRKSEVLSVWVYKDRK